MIKMPKMGTVRKAFEVLCYVSIKSYNERIAVGPDIYYNPYSHLLLTVNNPPVVIYNTMKRMHNREQLRYRFGLDDGAVLTLYSDDIIDRLMTLAAKRKDKPGVTAQSLQTEREGFF